MTTHTEKIETGSAGSTGIAAIPTTMRAAVYRGVNDVRVETVPVPEIGAGEVLVQDPYLRHLRDGPEEDSYRVALGAARVWARDGRDGGEGRRGRDEVRGGRSGDGVPPYSVRGVLLLPEAHVCAVRGVQEGRMHGWVYAVGRRVCRVHSGDGLDRRGRAGEDSRRHSVRAGGVYRAGEYLLQGGRDAGAEAG